MDKNTIIGIVLIVLIFLGYTQLTKPSEKELAIKRYNDSIALVEQNKVQATPVAGSSNAKTADSTVVTDTTKLADAFGGFSPSAKGQEKFYTLENELIKITLSNKGGRVSSVQLKKYRTHDSLPLILFDEKESSMGFTFVTNNNRVINSSSLYFEPVSTITKDVQGNSSDSGLYQFKVN